MKLRTALAAGLVDAGAASLATFIIQIAAVRVFDAGSLGVYAVFFSAYTLASQATQYLVLYPMEVAVLSLPRSARLASIVRSIRLAGMGPAAAMLSALAAVLVVGRDGTEIAAGLGLTMVIAGSTSPIYEHFKRMLHLSDRSREAAVLSAMQLGTLVGSLAGLAILGVAFQWLPFGALAISHAVTIVVGFLAMRPGGGQPLEVKWSHLARSGRWLVVAGLMPPLATFLGAGLVTRIAGSEELGFAQAAHVVSRPVLILGTGLLAALGYRFMEAGARRRATDATRYWKVYSAIAAAGGGVYVLVAGFEWFGNPMSALLPRAYEVGGLVAVALLANLVLVMVKPMRRELMGGHREPSIAGVDSAAAAAVVVVAAFAASLKAFAVPIGVLAAASVQLLGYLPARHALYGVAAPDDQSEGRPGLGGESS